MAKEKTYRATYASKIKANTAFSFTAGGPPCMARNRYLGSGKKGYTLKLQYFGGKNKKLKAITYQLENARKRVLFLLDDQGFCSAKQPEIDVITVDKHGRITA